jgi:hypothetical protein
MISDIEYKLFSIKLKNSKSYINNNSFIASSSFIHNSFNSTLFLEKNFIASSLKIFNTFNSNIKVLDENTNKISWENYTNSLAKITRQSKLPNAAYYTMISRRCYQKNGDIYWDGNHKNSIYIDSADFHLEGTSIFKNYLQNKITNLNFNTIKINTSDSLSGYFNRTYL